MPKITDLSAQTTPGANDVLAIVDIASATTKKITRTNLLKGAVLPNDTVTTAAIADGAVTSNKVNFADDILWSGVLLGSAPAIPVANMNKYHSIAVTVSYANTLQVITFDTTAVAAGITKSGYEVVDGVIPAVNSFLSIVEINAALTTVRLLSTGFINNAYTGAGGITRTFNDRGGTAAYAVTRVTGIGRKV